MRRDRIGSRAARASGVAFATMLAVSGLAPAGAHPATERYIPIGSSPGISGRSSAIGTIEVADPEGRRLILRTASGAVEVAVGEGARIWRDRSAQRQPSLPGGLEDCQVGRRAEVRFEDSVRRQRVLWIKVESP